MDSLAQVNPDFQCVLAVVMTKVVTGYGVAHKMTNSTLDALRYE